MDDPAPTVSSIQEALQAQARERAQFTIETGIALDADGRIVKEASMITPSTYPPSFASYEAFRAHINALVATKEAAIRTKERQ